MDCPHRHPSLQIIHSKQNGFCWAMLLRFACGTCWAWEMTARDARDSSNELSIFVTIVQHLACESKFSTKKTFTVSIKTPVCIEEFTLWQFSVAIFANTPFQSRDCHVTLAFRAIIYNTIYIGGSGGSMVTPGRKQERGEGLEEKRELTKGFI